MGGAEDGVDQFGIIRAVFDLQQGVFHLQQQFLAFGDERADDAVEVHHLTSFASNSSPSPASLNSSATTGLTPVKWSSISMC